ncbi:ankyrin repeat domain-containing protein [Caenimonas aquaedulcis]|uniref:Ankyrin repeat domain-containing protein n=1 Tax=Caenimonas aquaedulcis TaxID=2793270 RepID=A0A931MEZ8_9BURK|nr:ankyrin repeat domain-containing protein [Caenimonas aquaedulcis]MBG9386943.1 ankyrin repeat domain-containing protein [Caenimonas aquaedulcis]
MKAHVKFLAYCLVFIGFSAAIAGSYDDFFIAIKRDDPGAMTALLQRGFDPNTPGPDGLTGLFSALREGSMKVTPVLARWPSTKVESRTAQDESPLMMAALKGHLDIAKLLIERNADVNKTGWTPLHYAATGGHLAIIELLLENHAYIDAESPNGTTPLMMAAQYGSPQAVKLLLDSGADPGLKNQLGLTAMDFAQRGNRRDAAELLSASARAAQPKGKW